MKVFVLYPEEVHSSGGEAPLTAQLEGERFHYLVHVRRLGVGDLFEAVLNEQKMQAKLIFLDATSLKLSLTPEATPETSFPQLHLMAGLLKGRKLDDVVRQAAELGTTTFQPLQTEHCIAKWHEDQPTARLNRWSAIAREACQQSGAYPVMAIQPAVTLEVAVRQWENRGPLLFFHQSPLAKASLHGYLSSRPSQIGLLIGPEGGFSQQETDFLRKHGASPVWFGPTVFRAETACTAALAAVKILLLESSSWTIPSSKM